MIATVRNNYCTLTTSFNIISLWHLFFSYKKENLLKYILGNTFCNFSFLLRLSPLQPPSPAIFLLLILRPNTTFSMKFSLIRINQKAPCLSIIGHSMYLPQFLCNLPVSMIKHWDSRSKNKNSAVFIFLSSISLSRIYTQGA